MVLNYSKIKFFAVLVLLTASFALSAGCTGQNGQDLSSDKIPAEHVVPTKAPAPEQTSEMTAAPGETPAVTETESDTLSGEGSKKSRISLDDGVQLLTFEQYEPADSVITVDGGHSHFEIQNTFPAEKSVYINEEGKFLSSQAFIVIDGEDSEISVDTDSGWKLSFTYPELMDGIPPQTFKGAGNQATPFFRMDEGDYNFEIKTEDNTFAYIILMDDEGNEVTKDFSEGFDAVPLPYRRVNMKEQSLQMLKRAIIIS